MTGAQQRAVQDGIRDMQGPHPMNRLIQGDVGSGKTAVAAALWRVDEIRFDGLTSRGKLI